MASGRAASKPKPDSPRPESRKPRVRLCPRCEKPLPKDAHRSKRFHVQCKRGYSRKDRPEKASHAARQRRYQTRKGSPPAWERPFRAWDGEGEGDKFTLLASSDGDAIGARETGLGTENCFKFLLRDRPAASNVWFGFGYDVNMMLRDLSWHNLRELGDNCFTYWHGYRITYMPRKIFRVSVGEGDAKRTYTSYDAWGFFQSSFIAALEDWKIPIPQSIRRGKKARGDFASWKYQDIVQYNAKECVLLVDLMERLREAINAAGWHVSSWHGAGALSGWFLNQIKADQHIRDLPTEMEEAAACAYFGGRFDADGWGTVDHAYEYDITSAYPYAMTHLPALAEFSWKRTRKPYNPFSLCHIKWSTRRHFAWNPFPYRERSGRIIYPSEGEGWYWLVEIEAAQRHFGKHLEIKMLRAYTPNNENVSTPLAEPIRKAFQHRAALKEAGNPAHVPIKLGLNSLYGKMAQTVSFNRRPRFYSLAWAGYVTAFTRATLLDTLGYDPRCIMADSVKTTDPIPSSWIRPYELGGWSGGPISNLAVVESGLYAYDGWEWTRGYEPEALRYTVAELVKEFEQGTSEIPFEVNRFIGMKLALMSPQYARKWRSFTSLPRAIHSPWLSGTTKRMPMKLLGQKLEAREKWHIAWPWERGTDAKMSYPYKGKALPDDVQIREDRMLLECDEDAAE